MNTTVIETRRNPGCLLQLLWFALVGWWLGQLWVAVAWFLIVTVIGIPFGIAMINSLPKVIALREEPHRVAVTRYGGQVYRQEVQAQEINFFIRALYFVLIGWWFSALWMEAAFALCASIIGLPIGFWMFDRVPTVLTLKHS